MSNKKAKIKIGIKLVLLAVLLNFTIANFAFAQTPTPTAPSAPPKVKIDAAKLSKANSDKAYCEGEFRTEVIQTFIQKFTTLYVLTPQRTGVIAECKILSATLPTETTSIGRVYQPPGSADLEAKIKQGEGISRDDVINAEIQDRLDREKAGPMSRAIGWFLNAVLSVITSAILWFTALAGTVFVTALDWILGSSTPQAILIGWTIARDISNTFFILILIVIALGTILRVKDYSEYGHLLGELVLMAILVNFSYTIATTLIDFVNIFISMFKIEGNFDVWRILYQYILLDDLVGVPNGWGAGLVQGISKFIFAFVGLATFLALTLMVVIRVVALYILIILSPFAYALHVLPATKHFAHEWWENFLKNLIWVPIALFIMDIGILLAKNKQIDSSDSAFNVILIMAFFWGAVLAGEHLGAAGGKAIAGMAEKVGHKALHLATHSADNWMAAGARKTAPGRWNSFRRGLSYFSPGSWKEGYDQYAKQKHHESLTVAAAKRQDLFNRVISGGTRKTDYGLIAEQRMVADEQKLILTRNADELLHGIEEDLEGGNGEGAMARANILFKQADGNEAISKKYGTDVEGFQRFIDEKFVPVLGRDKAYRLAYDLSRQAEDAGHWNFARAYKSTVKNGKITYEKNAVADAEGEILKEIAKMPSQQAGRALNRLGRGYVELDMAAGTIPETEIHEGEVRFKTYEASHPEVVAGTKRVGEIMMKTDPGRINLGVAAWGSEDRKLIDPKATNETFNTNTAMNHMFTDSLNTFKDNRQLWISLGNKVSKMNDQAIEQARGMIGSVGMVATRVDGHIQRDTNGNIIMRPATIADIKDQVFTMEQANRLYENKRTGTGDGFTLAELTDAKADDLKNRINEYRASIGLLPMT